MRVDDRLRTSAEPRTYAVGDITGGPQFTHVSLDDHRIVRSNLQGGFKESTSGRLIPYCVFIDPELGRVGLTEREARRRGHDVRGREHPCRARCREPGRWGATRGMFKAVVERGSDQTRRSRSSAPTAER